MSKGREIVITRALDKSQLADVKPFSLEEMETKVGAFNALKEQPEEGAVKVEEVSNHSQQGMLTAEQLETLQQQAYQEAYEKGLAEGRTAGQAQALAEGRKKLLQQGAQLEAMIKSLAEPMQLLDLEIYDELVAMVITIAKHLISRELKTDPGQIIAATREALAILPMNSRNIKVHLHPEDALLVREILSVSEDESPWKIVEDATLSRGGLKIMTENSQVDASIESRLGEIVTRLLGDQRELGSE